MKIKLINWGLGFDKIIVCIIILGFIAIIFYILFFFIWIF
jgi:hypothetical protein